MQFMVISFGHEYEPTPFKRIRIQALTVPATSSVPRRITMYACVASCDHLECESALTQAKGKISTGIDTCFRTMN